LFERRSLHPVRSNFRAIAPIAWKYNVLQRNPAVAVGIRVLSIDDARSGRRSSAAQAGGVHGVADRRQAFPSG
jgi:hypothetical protein